MRVFPLLADDVINIAKFNGYKTFHGLYDLNIIGIRTADDDSNTFNDWLTVSHQRNDGTLAFYAFQATTDPGTYWREHPQNVKGTAKVCHGQYRGLWELGKHRGKYEALTQVGGIDVTRYKKGNTDAENHKIHHGVFGINLHHASSSGSSQLVDKWSAGCQVLADIDDFNFLMTLCKRQISSGVGSKFSYTLMSDADF